MRGTVSRSLELPDGYQHFDWDFDRSVSICDLDGLRRNLRASGDAMLQLYTQHQIFLDDAPRKHCLSAARGCVTYGHGAIKGCDCPCDVCAAPGERIIKHTRSSPNWDGGLVTFATCKHLMRTYDHDWHGAWIVGLCPRDLASNTVMFAGRIDEVFSGNYRLSERIREIDQSIFDAKSALTNPRGDLYTPIPFPGDHVGDWDLHDHRNFVPPTGHTRSEEFYEKSPGSVVTIGDTTSDGPVPKWWRDLEYIQRGRRPKSFVLRPCHIFSRPTVWTSFEPGRATLRLTASEFLDSLREKESR